MAGLTEELKAQKVDFVRFLWCDSANVLRAKVVPINFLRTVYQRGVGISFAQQGVPVIRDAFVAESGLGPVGEARLVGDWSSLLVLPYCDGHARVIGNMIVKGRPWEHCPRAFLRRMVQKASGLGIQFQAAFENEFYLMKETESGPLPIDDTLFCSVYGLDQNIDILTQIVSHLEAQGARVCSLHAESGAASLRSRSITPNRCRRPISRLPSAKPFTR